jgi:YVTN family beta-propeller protein
MKLRLGLIALVAGAAVFVGRGYADDAPPAGPYKLLKTVKVGGDGRWDYLAVDLAERKLYIPRTTRVDVYDVDTLAPAGSIADTAGVHGVGIAPEFNHGFATDGGDGTVTMFDTKTLKVIKKLTLGGGPDGIMYDAADKRIYVMSHKAPNLTAINAEDGSIIGTADLGGQPEGAISNGKGTVYVNLENTSEVVVVDAKAMKVTSRWKLGEGEGPTGIGLDTDTHRLFSCCGGNGKLVILNTDDGSVVDTETTGNGVDAGVFNTATKEMFAPGADATLTIVKENSAGSFTKEPVVKTVALARTCALDPKTGNIYEVTAEYGPPAAPAAGAPAPRGGGRGPMVAGSFQILVIGK